MVGRNIGHGASALRRKGVVAVTVLVTDATIRTMDDQFRLLVACDVPRRIYGLLLRVMHRGGPLIAGPLYRPSVLVRNNMLIFACHGGSPIVKLSKSQPSGWLANGRPL